MSYKIKEMPILERPRERFLEVGAVNLTDVELLSIIIKNGVKNKNVKEIAMEVINKYSYEDFTYENLKKIDGIGKVKAIEIMASLELGKRIYLKPNNIGKKLDSAEAIWKDAKYLFYHKKQEYFYCYYMNNKQKLIERKLLFIGTINSSITHTREVFKEAYRVSASSIICLHNHPSGEVEPSPQDIEFTNSLVKTGLIQGIPILDHIIVGDDCYYSFYEEEQLKNKI